MALSAGDRIGPYVIVARLGAGGMGEVYRARDSRLDRTIALKILSPDLAGDPNFRERFTREARAVAALNHPHICTVYDTGEVTVDGASPVPVQFLAMEFLDGETLAARLSRGPLPQAEALALAVQLARALDQAHRAGIVHRDLKPANVMLTKGSAKLLDFGLAKHLPGMGHADLTTAGMIVGTLQYMAPEQLAGQPADARTDIFAFGAVVYEMLTGKRNFLAAPLAATDGAMTEAVALPLSGIRSPALDRTVRKCLAVDPDERWQSAADLAAELEWIRDASSRAMAAPSVAPRRGKARERIAWVLAVLFAAAAVVIGLRPRPDAVPDATAKRFLVPLDDLQTAAAGTRPFSLFADGSAMAFLGGDATMWRIQVYTFADGRSRPLAGTERAMYPAVSPDGQWVAFFRDQKVMKAAVTGGPPVTLCDSVFIRGLTWASSDTIVVGASNGLFRVPASGGQAEALTSLEPGELRHVLPHALPDGRTILFTAIKQSGSMEDAEIIALPIATRQRQVLLKGAVDARYVPTGHLLYVRQSDVMAVPFDAQALRMSGTPFVAAPSIRVTPQSFDGFFDVARDGTLASMTSGASDLQRTLVWIDAKGGEAALPVPVRPYFHPSLLPGERGAIVEIEETPHNLWHLDLATGALTRLTHEGANHRAVASYDGRFIAYSSDRTTPRSLFRQATDGSGTPEQLASGNLDKNVNAWSRDGQWLAFTQTTPATRSDIWVLRMDGRSQPRPFLQSAAMEQGAAFSPDGRWLAYGSDESGRMEAMIAAFPGPGPRKQISIDGGETPSFSADGRKVFYRQNNEIRVVDIATDPVLEAGAPARAFELPGKGSYAFTGLANYAISRDADRVLTVKYVAGEVRPREVTVTVNWFATLRRAPAGR